MSKLHIPSNFLECAKCGIKKPLVEFYSRGDRKSKNRSWCKKCHCALSNACKKARIARSPTVEGDKLKETLLQCRYGISLLDRALLYKLQQGRCAVCKKEFPEFGKGGLCVDHSHKTGAIRGLLCSGCNRALGLLADSIPQLQSAIQYLSKKD